MNTNCKFKAFSFTFLLSFSVTALNAYATLVDDIAAGMDLAVVFSTAHENGESYTNIVQQALDAMPEAVHSDIVKAVLSVASEED